MAYEPKPIETERIELSEAMQDIVEKLAQHNHDVWAQGRISEGWVYGSARDDEAKTTPCLVPYSDLPEAEKDYDRRSAVGNIKAMIALGVLSQD